MLTDDDNRNNDAIEYEDLVEAYGQALIHKLRGHNVAHSFLDYWVPDADPVFGITGMVDSARISGLSEIAIEFSVATVPEDRLAELEHSVARFSQVSIAKHGNKYLLRATAMVQEGGSESDPIVARGGSRRTRWSPDQAAVWARVRRLHEDHADSLEYPDFAEVHPHFRAGLSSAMADLSHEGEPDNLVPAGLIRIQAREKSAALTLYVEPAINTVCLARHSGARAPSVRAVLDLFCRAAETRPLQEVAEHVALKVLDRLVDEDKAPPADGILLPSNAGAPFQLVHRLARQAFERYCATTAAGDGGVNFYYDPPPQYWLSLSPAERHEKIGRGIRAFLQSEGLYPDDIELLRLERNRHQYEVRGVVSFSDRVKTSEKPPLMRSLERRLRRDTDVEIELVADRAKDSSPLRRLS